MSQHLDHARPATGRSRVAVVGTGVVLAVAAAVGTAAPAHAADPAPANLRDATTAYYEVPSLTTADVHVAQAIITVPTGTCGADVTQALGAALTLGGSRIRTDTRYAGAQLRVECDGTQPVYGVEAYLGSGQSATDGAAPGDQLQVLLRVTATRATVNVLNLTSGVTTWTTGPGFTARAAYVGATAGYSQGAFPDFGSVRFTGVSVDRVALGRISSRIGYDQVQNTRIIAKAGPVNGGAFQVFQRGQYVAPAG